MAEGKKEEVKRWIVGYESTSQWANRSAPSFYCFLEVGN